MSCIRLNVSLVSNISLKRSLKCLEWQTVKSIIRSVIPRSTSFDTGSPYRRFLDSSVITLFAILPMS